MSFSHAQRKFGDDVKAIISGGPRIELREDVCNFSGSDSHFLLLLYALVSAQGKISILYLIYILSLLFHTVLLTCIIVSVAFYCCQSTSMS